MKSVYMVVAWIGLLGMASFYLMGAAGVPARGTPPAAPAPTAPAAQQKVDDASAALSKAHAALDGVVAPLRKTFEATPEWVEASKVSKEAQTKYEAARTAVMAKLQDSPDYAAAVEAKHNAQEAKDAILKDDAATMQQKMDAANAVMEAGKAVTKLETEALAADADFTAAKQKLGDTSAVIEKLKATFDNSIKDKPEWQQAKAAVDTAQQDWDKAKQELAAAQQADAAAAAAYQEQLAAWQKAQNTKKKGAG